MDSRIRLQFSCSVTVRRVVYGILKPAGPNLLSLGEQYTNYVQSWLIT